MSPTQQDTSRARLVGALVGVLWVVGLPVLGVSLGIAVVSWAPWSTGGPSATVRPAAGAEHIDAAPAEGFTPRAPGLPGRPALVAPAAAGTPRLSGRAPHARLAVHLQTRACADCAWRPAGVQRSDAGGRFDFGPRTASGQTRWWRVWTPSPGGRSYSAPVTTGTSGRPG